MEIEQGVFPRLLFATFGVAVAGFFVRGFGQLVVGREAARLLAAPVFGVGVLLAAVAFVVSLLFRLGLAGESDDSRTDGSA